MKKIYNFIQCKQCKYHVPQSIHCHGEYFGSCRVLEYLFVKTKWYLIDSICGDEEDCIILVHLRETLEGRCINLD